MTALNLTYPRLLHGSSIGAHLRRLFRLGILRERLMKPPGPRISSGASAQIERKRLDRPCLRLPFELDNPFDVPKDSFRRSIR